MRSTLSARWGWWLLVVMMMGWLLLMTIRPDGHISPQNINLIPGIEHGRALVCLFSNRCASQRSAFWFLLIDLIGNIFVFMPLGLGLAGALDRGKLKQTIGQATLGGFIFSLTIELLQLAVPSRSTDVDDLIFNTLGTVLGACLYILFKRYFTRR